MITISKRIIISFILFMCFTNNTFGSGYVKINAELNDMAGRGAGTADLNSDLRRRGNLSFWLHRERFGIPERRSAPHGIDQKTDPESQGEKN
ncbi:hypothetical protein YW49_001417 [Salmonella enterica subsp. enterica]|nr:hypothetical protein [Salmonella enterica subsp. enterica]